MPNEGHCKFKVSGCVRKNRAQEYFEDTHPFHFFPLSQSLQPLDNGSEIQSLNHSGVRRHDNRNEFGHLWIFVDSLRLVV